MTVEWHERHFHHLSGVDTRLIRRASAIKLVQLASDADQFEAATLLHLPQRTARCYAIVNWGRNPVNAAGFRHVVESLALELHNTTDLIDYGARRAALRDWTIDPSEWHDLTADLRHEHDQRQLKAPTDWGDAKRITASALVWTA